MIREEAVEDSISINWAINFIKCSLEVDFRKIKGLIPVCFEYRLSKYITCSSWLLCYINKVQTVKCVVYFLHISFLNSIISESIFANCTPTFHPLKIEFELVSMDNTWINFSLEKFSWTGLQMRFKEEAKAGLCTHMILKHLQLGGP